MAGVSTTAMTDSGSFGALLRSLRVAAGMSIGELARRVNYSKSYITKIEHGLKPPTAFLAMKCDAVLNAGGELAALVNAVRGDEDNHAMLLSAGRVLHWVDALPDPFGGQEAGYEVRTNADHPTSAENAPSGRWLPFDESAVLG
jgi:transcriptional regulator with XRE-family HTH domain